jgi:hypothetical protein
MGCQQSSASSHVNTTSPISTRGKLVLKQLKQNQAPSPSQAKLQQGLVKLASGETAYLKCFKRYQTKPMKNQICLFTPKDAQWGEIKQL